jgi:hypothetical protein
MRNEGVARKKLSKVLKYAAIAIASLALIGTILLFVFSYGIVKSLSSNDARPPNETVPLREKHLSVETTAPRQRETDRIWDAFDVHSRVPKPEKADSERGVELIRRLNMLKELDVLAEELLTSSGPHFCDIICDEGDFIARRENGEHPVEAILRFYRQEGSKSFEDPKFRIAFELTFPVRILVPRSLREILIELDHSRGRESPMTNLETAALAARFQFELIQRLLTMKTELPLLRHRNDQLKKVREIRNQCRNASAEELHPRCLQIDPEF